MTAQATASGGNNALVRAYTWGLDASGSMQGAGGVGGLLMVNAGSGGVHFPAYDLKGNMMGLVNATNGIISAKYEYGPFGEVFCSVGDMAKVNPFGFSTKYTDNETDLLYYGYRYYSPALGRWLSRDPIEEQGGLNLYEFVNNDPVNAYDMLGLWGEYVHYEMTKRWALRSGYESKYAEMLASADVAVDGSRKGLVGATTPMPWGDQSYHFNRPWSEDRDSRLEHFIKHFESAQYFCTLPIDEPEHAVKELGTALHPLQDWVAHGDYGFDNPGNIWVTHNNEIPFFTKTKVDDIYLDAEGSIDGRPNKEFIKKGGKYVSGGKRFKLTKKKYNRGINKF